MSGSTKVFSNWRYVANSGSSMSNRRDLSTTTATATTSTTSASNRETIPNEDNHVPIVPRMTVDSSIQPL